MILTEYNQILLTNKQQSKIKDHKPVSFFKYEELILIDEPIYIKNFRKKFTIPKRVNQKLQKSQNLKYSLERHP